jgi:hypothetical protein
MSLTAFQNICECSAGGKAGGASYSAKTFARRCLTFVEWATPGAILVLMPKCPLCLAAYIAIGTGVGVSVSTAAYLRVALLVACAVSILFLTSRLLRHFFPKAGYKNYSDSSSSFFIVR